MSPTWRELPNSCFSQLFWSKIILATIEPKLNWASLLVTVWNACTGPWGSNLFSKGQVSILPFPTISVTQECCTLAILYGCLFHPLLHCGPPSVCLKMNFTTTREHCLLMHMFAIRWKIWVASDSITARVKCSKPGETNQKKERKKGSVGKLL